MKSESEDKPCRTKTKRFGIPTSASTRPGSGRKPRKIGRPAPASCTEWQPGRRGSGLGRSDAESPDWTTSGPAIPHSAMATGFPAGRTRAGSPGEWPISVARKNGKSGLIAALALAYLVGPLNATLWRGIVVSLDGPLGGRAPGRNRANRQMLRGCRESRSRNTHHLEQSRD